MEVTVAVEVEKPVADVAGIVCDFGRLHEWNPVIEGCEVTGVGEGAVRVLTIAGERYRDELVGVAGDGLGYVYRQLEGPLPVASLRAFVAVEAQDGGTSRIQWSVEVEPGDMPPVAVEGAFRALMKVALESAKRKFELAPRIPV